MDQITSNKIKNLIAKAEDKKLLSELLKHEGFSKECQVIKGLIQQSDNKVKTKTKFSSTEYDVYSNTRDSVIMTILKKVDNFVAISQIKSN